jgi:hypothetical protein
MDTNMEDVGRAPAEVSPVLNFEPTTIPTLDGWIESLMSCKQLAEPDVQRLCDKVSRLPIKRDVMELLLDALCIERLNRIQRVKRSSLLNKLCHVSRD